MIRALALFTLFASCLALASSTINYIEVDDDVILFSTTDEKSGISPSCVDADHRALWSASLDTNSGRAIYSLLLTAMAKEQGLAVNISSADDCSVVDGIERADNVTLAVTTASASSTSTSAFPGTIFDSLMAVELDKMVNTEGKFSSEGGFFTGLGGATGERYYRNITFAETNTLTQVASHTGSGWITSIVLPYLAEQEEVSLELIIDGVNYQLSGVMPHQEGRFVMGLLANSSANKNRLMEPAEVVSEGKGIPFSQGFELWINISGYNKDDANEYFGIGYFKGHPQ